MAVFDILIPTWNNPDYLIPCVNSIIHTGVIDSGFATLTIIDNGTEFPASNQFEVLANTKVLRPGKNLGWEGGLKLGLENTSSKFVCFQNDDTLIPRANNNMYHNLLWPFQDSNVGAVGPTTTTASGIQSIMHPNSPLILTEVPWLIFFTVMLKRQYVEEVGGIDTTLSGGDDFDMCMRLRKAGKKLMIQPMSFLLHHGFITGTRVHGNHEKVGGWNNVEFTDKVNHDLIVKHGFGEFVRSRNIPAIGAVVYDPTDKEGDIIRSMINGEKNILELACGGQKTIDKSIGIDIVPKGNPIQNLHHGIVSAADVIADLSKDELPFEDDSQEVIIVRHYLEHALDLANTIKQWKRKLKQGGKLIIAVPDQDVSNSIPLNPEHVHAFNMDSLGNLMKQFGFKILSNQSSNNGISFVGSYEKC